MTYTEDQLTGWFEGVPPVKDGVYQTSAGNFAHWSKLNGWGAGRETVEKAIEAKDWGLNKDFYHLAYAWRGLSQNPNAKPKRSGNKRKVMYVVVTGLIGSEAIHKIHGIYSTMNAAKAKQKQMGWRRTDVRKIRFRTPEHN